MAERCATELADSASCRARKSVFFAPARTNVWLFAKKMPITVTLLRKLAAVTLIEQASGGPERVVGRKPDQFALSMATEHVLAAESFGAILGSP